MRHRAFRFLSIGLVACLLILSGTVYAQSVRHAAQHAHHKAATHGTVLCSWMCAAGQVLEAVSVGIQPELGPIAMADADSAGAPPALFLSTPSSRGPPFFSV